MKCSTQPRILLTNFRLTIAVAAVIALAALTITPAQAQTYTVIHNFTGGADGGVPNSTLAIDAAGNLYGTTVYGGNRTQNCNTWCGVVFKLKPSGQGWIVTPLYEFNGSPDGSAPVGVVFGPNGTLYGTTFSGGVSCRSNSQYGCGTVFNLRPSPTPCKSVLCPWNETVLYRFNGGSNDGAGPNSPVVFDATGNLYGTTFQGGVYTPNCSYGVDWCGTVFELSPSRGGWTESLPYFFTGGSAGGPPEAGLAIDAAGNLYGTTLTGGVYGGGVVFELTPSNSGWVENTLYSLPGASGNGGDFSEGTPIFDPAGNLYDTTQVGGPNGGGTVFELSPAGGGWNFSLLYGLSGRVEQNGPVTGVVRDSAGNLYGTAYSLGPDNIGLIFKLSPSNGGWNYTLLHQFDFSDGCIPTGGVTLDAHGNLYGTASGCGANGYGVVWEITP
jgi:uncharacterized repeat protein (TIGR03803 family)